MVFNIRATPYIGIHRISFRYEKLKQLNFCLLIGWCLDPISCIRQSC